MNFIKFLICVTLFSFLLTSCGYPNDTMFSSDATNSHSFSTSSHTTTTRQWLTTSCSHHWNDANCTSPETCSICGEQRGEAKEHDYFQAKCLVCKSTTPNYDVIQDWLVDNYSTVDMFQYQYQCIKSSRNTFDFNGDPKELANIQDYVHTMDSNLKELLNWADDYPELSFFVKNCTIEMPLYSGSSYPIYAESYAEKVAVHTHSHFESLCDDFGVTITITYE